MPFKNKKYRSGLPINYIDVRFLHLSKEKKFQRSSGQFKK